MADKPNVFKPFGTPTIVTHRDSFESVKMAACFLASTCINASSRASFAHLQWTILYALPAISSLVLLSTQKDLLTQKLTLTHKNNHAAAVLSNQNLNESRVKRVITRRYAL
jgi:hypothetical protein